MRSLNCVQSNRNCCTIGFLYYKTAHKAVLSYVPFALLLSIFYPKLSHYLFSFFSNACTQSDFNRNSVNTVVLSDHVSGYAHEITEKLGIK